MSAMHRSLCLHPPGGVEKPVAKTLVLPGDKLQNEKNRLYAVMVKSDRLWPPGATLYYAFDKDEFGIVASSRKQEKVLLAHEWSRYANIRFEKIQEPSRARIRISCNSLDGCWSFVGTGAANDAQAAITMNLGSLTDEDEFTDEEKGHVLHEFGHALGLLHEHQSPARHAIDTLEAKAKAKLEAKTFFASQSIGNFSDDMIDTQILLSMPTDSLSNYSEVDSKSIMLYELPENLVVDLGFDKNIAMRRNFTLSDMDKAFMTIVYPFLSSPNPEAPEWTLARALDIAGLTDQKDAQTRTAILSHKDFALIRRDFSAWCMQERAKEAKGNADLVLGF